MLLVVNHSLARSGALENLLIDKLRDANAFLALVNRRRLLGQPYCIRSLESARLSVFRSEAMMPIWGTRIGCGEAKNRVAESKILRALGRSLNASHYGMHIRLMSLIEGSMNLTNDFPLLRGLHKSHLFRIVQADRPGMLQAGNGGDGSALISFVSTSEWPTPVNAIFRAGTRSTMAKNS